MCTTPKETCLRSFFLKVFFLPFFSGAAAPAAAAGFAMKSVLGPWSLVVGRWQNLTSQRSCIPTTALKWYLPDSYLYRCLGFGQQPKTKDQRRFLRLCRRLLLLRDCSFARTLAGASVGVRALSGNRQIAPMPEAAIGADFDEPLDAHRNFLAQIAFDQTFAFNDLADAVDFVLAQVLDLFHGIHLGLVENARRPGNPDSVNVRQRDKRSLVSRKIDACNACHNSPVLMSRQRFCCQLLVFSF